MSRAGLGERIDDGADHREGGDLSISAGKITFRGTIRRILPQAHSVKRHSPITAWSEPRRNVRSPLGSARSTTGAHHPVWRFALDSPTRPLLVAAQIRAIIVPTPRRSSAAALADGFVPLESDRRHCRIRLHQSRTLVISVPFRPKRPASTGGTRSSNPLCSSGQSVSRKISPPTSKTRAFPARVRGGAGAQSGETGVARSYGADGR